MLKTKKRLVSIGIPLLVILSLVALAAPGKTQAAQTWVARVTSDCSSIDIELSTIYLYNDEHGRDYFRMIVFESTGVEQLANFDAYIRQENSPTYWRTGPLSGTPEDGLYHIEIWDIDDDGERIRKLDDVFHQCHTGSTWRRADEEEYEDDDEDDEDDDDEDDEDDDEEDLDDKYPPPPNIEVGCMVTVPIATANPAPEPGVVMVVWSYGTGPLNTHYHEATIQMEAGEYLADYPVSVPCGVYILAFYQPFSTNEHYFLASQYSPDLFGSMPDEDLDSPSYYTHFPELAPPVVEEENVSVEAVDP
jgi:hypothetical protein